MILRSGLLLLGLTASGLAQAALPRDIDGAWFSPAQSGHGLTIERVDADSAVILWHVYDPDGAPLTLYVEAQIEGNAMQGEAFAPSGMRFGAFDPATLSLPSWGTVRLEFSDCLTAQLHYASSQTGYGSGELPITRLLPLRNPQCSLDLPVGPAEFAGVKVSGTLLFNAAAVEDPSAPGFQAYVSGLIDAQGRLWLSGEPPNQDFASGFALIAEPQASPAGEAVFEARALANGWLNPYLGEVNEALHPADRFWQFRLPLSLRPDGLKGMLLEGHETGWHGTLQSGSQGSQALRAGRYAFFVAAQFDAGAVNAPRWEMKVDADGRLCVRPSGQSPTADCRLEGRITAQSDALFEFELQDVDASRPPFSGVGTVQYRIPGVIFSGDSLRMVGENGETGLALASVSFCTEEIGSCL